MAANFLSIFFSFKRTFYYYILKETNLKVKHQRKAAYKQLFSDALPLNSYGEALQVKNERFCQLFKLANKGMNQ